ncbi:MULTISPECIES: hypothetical protein [unclassified Janthinobacterium]|uniref:hypothetical protein n=2 Tax=Janthinobacterium TaxID=29580 RepID=UPI0018CA4304|nr:hypothetical protein [Janthinobacterium sp. CG_23.4]MDH6160032.1 hypothetical protein [Janthinobacterium sp. CG_23.4]
MGDTNDTASMPIRPQRQVMLKLAENAGKVHAAPKKLRTRRREEDIFLLLFNPPGTAYDGVPVVQR